MPREAETILSVAPQIRGFCDPTVTNMVASVPGFANMSLLAMAEEQLDDLPIVPLWNNVVVHHARGAELGADGARHSIDVPQEHPGDLKRRVGPQAPVESDHSLFIGTRTYELSP